jgi:hypothetical protein
MKTTMKIVKVQLVIKNYEITILKNGFKIKILMVVQKLFKKLFIKKRIAIQGHLILNI